MPQLCVLQPAAPRRGSGRRRALGRRARRRRRVGQQRQPLAWCRRRSWQVGRPDSQLQAGGQAKHPLGSLHRVLWHILWPLVPAEDRVARRRRLHGRVVPAGGAVPQRTGSAIRGQAAPEHHHSPHSLTPGRAGKTSCRRNRAWPAGSCPARGCKIPVTPRGLGSEPWSAVAAGGVNSEAAWSAVGERRQCSRPATPGSPAGRRSPWSRAGACTRPGGHTTAWRGLLGAGWGGQASGARRQRRRRRLASCCPVAHRQGVQLRLAGCRHCSRSPPEDCTQRDK